MSGATGTTERPDPGPSEPEQSTTLAPRDAILGTEGLTKEFGGLVAVDGVDLAVERGELHAVIGPNGAGKTTLFNTVTGALAPTAGTVWFDGQDVTDRPQEERPHLGLARSFQSNQLFTDLSVLENVRVVVQAANTGTFSFALRGDGRAGDRNTSRSGDSEPDHGQQGETHDQRATFSGHAESPHDRRNGSSGVNRSRRFQATGKGIGAHE